jgi:hypothetical protein
MKRIIPWLLAVGAVLVAGTAAAANDGGYPTGPPSKAGHADLLGVVDKMGAPDEWGTFLAAVAHRESRFDNLAENTSSGEAAAARRAYQRQRDRGHFASAPWPDSAYTFGSGGWYGILPANGMIAFVGTELENLDPRTAVHDPVTSTIMAFEYARRIFGWGAFDGTWLGLRVGWANPSRMGDPEFVAEVAGRFAKDLRAIGAPESFMHERVATMTGYPGAEALFYQMKGDA